MLRALESTKIKAGDNVSHADLGEGVVLGIEPTGFVRVYFRTHGERQVPGSPKVGYTQLYGAPGVAGVSILSL